MPNDEDSSVIRDEAGDSVDVFLDEPATADAPSAGYRHVATEAPVEFGILDYLDAVLTGWRRA